MGAQKIRIILSKLFLYFSFCNCIGDELFTAKIKQNKWAYSDLCYTRETLFLPNWTNPLSSMFLSNRETTSRAVPSSLANCSCVTESV